MRTGLSRTLTLAAVATAAAFAAYAGEPSFIVRCMQTSGPTAEKYGTYYFFLKEGQVKGALCSLPGRPCPIVSQTSETIVFQTPGEDPDTLSIDLRTGAIKKKSTSGVEWTYTCRQIGG